MNPAKTAESIEMPFGLWTQVGRGTMYSMGFRYPMGRSNFGGKGRHIVKYRDLLLYAVQKPLNQSNCRSGMDLGGPKGACVRKGCALAPPGEYD